MPGQVIAPTFAGNAEYVTIRGRRFGLPPGSKTRRVRRRRAEIIYVMLYGQELHALVADGELSIPDNLRPALAARYFG